MPRAERRKKTVTETLRAAIHASRLSGHELADLSGVNRRMIDRFLSGQRTLRGPAIDRLAAALGLKLTKERKRRKPKPPRT